jgi:hypothetical protein
MGYSLGWVAVRGAAPESVRDILGVRDTGARGQLVESPQVGAQLPDGWYVVAFRRGEHVMRDALLGRHGLPS